MAKDAADGETVLSGVGTGVLRIVSAPVRLTLRMLGSDLDREDAFELESD